MDVLKVGVLTFHRCINYGSYWQARCLAEGIQARGHHASIIDHDSRRINLAEWKCAMQPVLPTHVPETDHPVYREKIEKFFALFESLPLSKRFDIDKPEDMENYDIVVVGSDEVWNLYHPWFGGNPLFYGDGLRTQQLISYAASYGNYPASYGLEESWAERLRNFDSISVRDENSWTIVKNAIGMEPEIVLDPCLQFKINPDERESKYWENPYIALYGHNFTVSFIRKIRQYADSRKLPLVSIGYRNDWADEQWINADPHDFAQFIARSEAVATNFFHGCVFAIRNEKPFVCESSSYRSFKVQGLMSKLGGEQHLISDEIPAAVVNNLLSQPLSPVISQTIKRLRISSNRYLDEALKIKQLKNESVA
ncbi:polysaccharide pyruvyl transferase family protein [Dyadobacter flavalbus]|uniref:Polysaccharide pyruvyl transferase family protein n=1 Tax=Dyadobacter flavalbus TaxID=2579942 RepID=A0A5M8QVE2_9BACT|nr:polysaccharide pyruvyl transferase family protein [Dyadobacter flavalbus]KAA6439030.1 polysaccharide pyruvyl transferase family protein [Dyadobacter flavalbus]